MGRTSVITNSPPIPPARRDRTLRSLARQRQQLGQRPQLQSREVSKLPSMNLGDGPIELAEQLQASRRDAGADLATILGAALPLDQSGVLEPVEKSRNIRHLRHHSVPYLVSAEAVFAGA